MVGMREVQQMTWWTIMALGWLVERGRREQETKIDHAKYAAYDSWYDLASCLEQKLQLQIITIGFQIIQQKGTFGKMIFRKLVYISRYVKGVCSMYAWYVWERERRRY